MEKYEELKTPANLHECAHDFKCREFAKSCDIVECFDFIKASEQQNTETEYVWIMGCNTVFGGICVNQNWKSDAARVKKRYYPKRRIRDLIIDDKVYGIIIDHYDKGHPIHFFDDYVIP